VTCVVGSRDQNGAAPKVASAAVAKSFFMTEHLHRRLTLAKMNRCSLPQGFGNMNLCSCRWPCRRVPIGNKRISLELYAERAARRGFGMPVFPAISKGNWIELTSDVFTRSCRCAVARKDLNISPQCKTKATCEREAARWSAGHRHALASAESGDKGMSPRPIADRRVLEQNKPSHYIDVRCLQSIKRPKVDSPRGAPSSLGGFVF
jgi:hypothetical protein